LQIGLIAIEDRQFTQAEEAFTRVQQDEPGNPTALDNLFWTRLSLGQTVAAVEQLPALLDQTTDPGKRVFLNRVQALLQGGSAVAPAMSDMTAEEERQLIDTLFQVGRL
jgi:predicted Zn-dependent protease